MKMMIMRGIMMMMKRKMMMLLVAPSACPNEDCLVVVIGQGRDFLPQLRGRPMPISTNPIIVTKTVLMAIIVLMPVSTNSIIVTRMVLMAITMPLPILYQPHHCDKNSIIMAITVLVLKKSVKSNRY